MLVKTRILTILWLIPILMSNMAVAQHLRYLRKTSDRDTLVDPMIQGVWKSVTGGYLLNAGSRGIKLHSYTSKHCYEEKNDYLANLFNTQAQYEVIDNSDTILLYMQDLGAMTSRLQVPWKFFRIQNLPPNCISFGEMQKQNSLYLFELFWLTLKENYAFAKERNINWQQIYDKYFSKISGTTTRTELFEIFGEIVTLTHDQHTKIIDSSGKTRQYSGVPSARLLRQVFDNQREVKDFGVFTNQFFSNNYRNISDSLLLGKGKKVANGKLEWGDLGPDIGYLHVHSLSGFTTSSYPRNQQLDSLRSCMDEIMKAFQRKKAVIIDVAFNFGGFDAAGLTISGYFTDKPVTVYTREGFHNSRFFKSPQTQLYPSGKTNFTGPVYVVCSDISRSAAETFVMQMKALPNVKVIGTPTLGILSDMLGKSIGDFYLTLSYEKYVSPAGKMFEARGVDVDNKLEIFPRDNIFNGHREAIRKIANWIQDGTL